MAGSALPAICPRLTRSSSARSSPLRGRKGSFCSRGIGDSKRDRLPGLYILPHGMANCNTSDPLGRRLAGSAHGGSQNSRRPAALHGINPVASTPRRFCEEASSHHSVGLPRPVLFVLITLLVTLLGLS